MNREQRRVVRMSGRIPEDIERAILDVPERWDDLRAWRLGSRRAKEVR